MSAPHPSLFYRQQIAKEALGKPLKDSSALLHPIATPEEEAWAAVMYELCKYRAAHGLPNPDGWSPEETALEGIKLCPAYFEMIQRQE